jgi:hypothetical protein
MKVYLWQKIKREQKKGSVEYNYFSNITTNTFLGKISEKIVVEGKSLMYRNIFNKLTIIIYVLLFANFILIMIE